mgnify:CR=1 FL=1
MKIIQKTFDRTSAVALTAEWYGKNWPVVYILGSAKEVYIGETTSISARMKQHLENTRRGSLDIVNIIVDRRFNKSAILDIESKLIECMSADKSFSIQNSNSGMRNHDYYEKSVYEAIFKSIWKELQQRKIVHHELDVLYNSELFKYTPYKRLTEEQYSVAHDLVANILNSVMDDQLSTTLINGEAGTGKTVLAMYLLKLFSDNRTVEFLANENESYIEKYESIHDKLKEFKIGLVVPMTSLRGTLKKVASSISGLSTTMIFGPNDVSKSKYDLLIVDESHRLFRRVGITGYGSYDSVNKKLGFDKESTQLEWIQNQARHTVFFYDSTQSVRPSDVRRNDFMTLMQSRDYVSYSITSQLRVLAGQDYIRYISALLSDQHPEPKKFGSYDFRIFDSIASMRNTLIQKEKEVGLSRLVAGYAWPWSTKGMSYAAIKSRSLYDFTIENESFIWNSTGSSWVISKNAKHEVGSIHTIQGYDLNYVGVIIGPDITYNPFTEKIEIHKENYYDKKGKSGIENDDELKMYILNIYKVLLTRGIMGTYVYVVDSHLRDYFKKYIEL